MYKKRIIKSCELIRKEEKIGLITSIKLKEEICALKKASKLTDEIFSQIIKNWKRFKTEKDIEIFILKKINLLHLSASFPPIVASGSNASKPHAIPQDKRLTNGFCVIDMGLIYQGYCSDMTRTVFIGKPKLEEIKLYYSLLEAQEKTIAKVKIGMKANELDAYCREILGKKLSRQFIHGLGHGVGTQIHEWPSIKSNSDAKFKENMVFTIEPGIYKKNKYGIRIEDVVLLTKKGAIPLNKSSKRLILL